jgi:hypothetical protein
MAKDEVLIREQLDLPQVLFKHPRLAEQFAERALCPMKVNLPEPCDHLIAASELEPKER